MGVGLVDVDVIEEVVAHEVVIALHVVVREAAVLVEVIGVNLREVDVALLVPLDELVISADGRAAGSEAEDAVGLEDDLGRDDVGGLAAHVLVVFGVNDLHASSFCCAATRARSRER